MAVARAGTFTAAGRQLGLTQSAVSAQMRRLEDDLGVKLFERTAKSAVLSAAGREMLPQAEEIVALAERIVGAAGGGHISGLLRVGAIASAQQGLLVDALAQFRDAFPDVRVRIVPGVSLSLLGQVDAAEIDMAVLIRPPFALPPELAWRPLLREPMALAVPAGLPARPWRELLASHPFIRYDRTSFGGRLVDMFLKKHRIAVREAIELDEMEAIANLVRRGLGVALLPRTRRFDARGLDLYELGEAGFTRDIGLIVRLPHDPASLAGHLAECLLNAAGTSSGA